MTGWRRALANQATSLLRPTLSQSWQRRLKSPYQTRNRLQVSDEHVVRIVQQCVAVDCRGQGRAQKCRHSSCIAHWTLRQHWSLLYNLRSTVQSTSPLLDFFAAWGPWSPQAPSSISLSRLTAATFQKQPKTRVQHGPRTHVPAPNESNFSSAVDSSD